jgi:sugar phosphate isomerase/epimerase
MDMVTSSRDARVVSVAKERILHNIEIATQLKAKIVTFCSCFNPCIAAGSPGYVDGYKRRQIKFWSEILDSAAEKNLTLVYENLWEPKPELLRDVIDGINSENFKALLDTGHANIFSKTPIERWVEVLADRLVYIHLNETMETSTITLCPEMETSIGADSLKH